MDALKDAASELVDTIMADENNSVKVGVVPFSQYVNVGLSRRNASWITVPADYSETEWDCDTEYPNATKSNCTTQTSTCYSDGVPYSCTNEQCDWDYGDPVEQCEWETDNYDWRGCVGSRNYPLNVKDESYGSMRVPGLIEEWCPEELLPMTTNKASVLAKIQNLWVQGDTYIPSGLAWACASFLPRIPLPKRKLRDDGSGIRREGAHLDDGRREHALAGLSGSFGNDTGLANTLTRELCDEIKGKKIFIHTIAFEVTDATIKNLLEDCASDPSNYYNAGDAAALADAFNSIGDDLKELALTK